MNEEKVLRGTVKSWNEARGWGFIIGPNGVDHFIHFSQIRLDGYKCLFQGETVSFTPYSLKGRLRAKNVIPISHKGRISEPGGLNTPIRRNPFNPHNPIQSPHLFSGRRDRLHTALTHLVNNGNILLTGDRGIGKSSIIEQIHNIFGGDTTLLHSLGIQSEVSFNFVVASHVCQPGQSLQDVVAAIADQLLDAIPHREQAKRTKTIWGFDYIAHFKRVVETTTNPERDIPSRFTRLLQEGLRATRKDGICLSIDEIDVLDPATNLTAFIKATRQDLGARANVVFMVSGVTEGAIRVAKEHRSHNRVFERLHIETMTEDELENILYLHLESTRVKLAKKVARRIVALSFPFPYAVHYLGLHCFARDVDGVIDEDDLKAALDHIINDLHKNEFEQLRGQANSETYNEIIQLLSDMEIDTLAPNVIASRLSTTSQQIGPMLGKLSELRILRRDDRGRYGIIEPLFKIYCRWYDSMGGGNIRSK